MVFAQKQVDWQATCVRYRNVEGVRMTEQTDREAPQWKWEQKKEHAHVARGVVRVEPSALQRKTQRKNTKRRHKTWVLRKPGFELKPNHVCKQRLKQKMKSVTRMMKGERGGGELDEAKIRAKGKV